MIKVIKWLVSICLMSVSVQTSFSQADGVFGNSLSDQLLIKMKSGLNLQPYESIQGSPYSNDSFIVGKVYTIKGVLDDIPLRYDQYSQWIEFKDKGQIYVMDPAPAITKISFGDESIYVYPINDQGRYKQAYFYQLDSGEVKLLMKKTIKFNPKVAAKPMATETPAKFTPSKILYFIKAPNHEAIEITTTKKLAELFPDHQSSLESYISRKKIKLKEDDLLELWAYYRGLQTK